MRNVKGAWGRVWERVGGLFAGGAGGENDWEDDSDDIEDGSEYDSEDSMEDDDDWEPVPVQWNWATKNMRLIIEVAMGVEKRISWCIRSVPELYWRVFGSWVISGGRVVVEEVAIEAAAGELRSAWERTARG